MVGLTVPVSFLTEEDWARMRPVNLHVTGRAVRVLSILVMLWTTGLNCANVMRYAVTRKAKLIDGAKPQ